MTPNNSAHKEPIDNSLPSYQVAKGNLHQENSVVLNVSQFQSDHAPLIAADHSNNTSQTWPGDCPTVFSTIFRQNALPAYYETVNAPRVYNHTSIPIQQPTDKCQTYRNIFAFILAIIAGILILYIIIYGLQDYWWVY